jgi:hypothetical protein
MTNSDLLVLLDDFNFYRSHTDHFQKLQREQPFIRPPKLNKERTKLLVAMVEWCKANGLEPRHWIYCLFARGRWLFAPKLTPGFLMSESGLKWYQGRAKTVDDRLYRQRLAQTQYIAELAAGTSLVYDPNLHLSAEVEARKGRHVARGDWARCLEDSFHPDAPTLGFHPDSGVCFHCPIKPECCGKTRAVFPFDLVALRERKITIQQAQLASVVSRGRP